MSFMKYVSLTFLTRHEPKMIYRDVPIKYLVLQKCWHMFQQLNRVKQAFMPQSAQT